MSLDPKLTADEFMQALCLYREARGESKAAKAGVLAVIRNRAADSRKRWPQSTTGVITQQYQFSSFNANDPNAKVWPNAATPGQYQAWRDCCEVVTVPLEADPVQGANHYESLPPGAPRPDWASPSNLVMTIGAFRFYKL